MDIKHVLSLNPLQPVYAGTPERRSPSPTGSGGSTSRAASSRSGTRATGFRFDNEEPRHRVWLEPYRLADRLVTNGEWLEFMADGGYRRARAVALRRLGDGSTPRAGGRRSTGPSVDGVWFEHTLHGTCPVEPGAAGRATSASTRPTPSPPGPASGCPPRRSGSTASRSTARRVDVERQPRRRRDLPPARGRAGDRPAAPGATATAGSGPPRPTSPIPGSTRRRARSASTTASSCPTRWCCAAAARSPRRVTRARRYRNFFPHGARWALSGVRLADGGAPAAVTGMTRGQASRSSRCCSIPTGPRAAWSTTYAEGSGRTRAACRRSGSTTTAGRSCSTRSRGCRSTTRTEREREILREHAGRDRARRPAPPPWSSSAAARSDKTRTLLDAFTATGQLERFVPVDVSEATLRDAADADLRVRYPGVQVEARRRRLHAAPRPPAARRSPDGRVPRRHDRQPLRRGARGLPRRAGRLARARRLGAARHRPGEERRPPDRGVRRLAGRDRRVRHATACACSTASSAPTSTSTRSPTSPFWDPHMERMDLRLRAEMPQRVTIPGADLVFDLAAGEEIRVEISTKFRPEGIAAELDRGRLRRRAVVDRPRRRLRPHPRAPHGPPASALTRARREPGQA